MVAKQARVPRLIEGVDLTALPLSPLEGFVLSRIDGAASVRVLADLTNLPEADVYRMALRLIELGAAEWARESVSLPRATSRAATNTPSQEVEVPPFLRGPPTRPPSGRPARVRMRPKRTSSVRAPTRPKGVYSSKPATADEVETHRTSVFPARPLASHTGSSFPPGEIEEHSDDLPLPDLDPSSDASAPLELPLPPPPPDVELPPPPSAASLASLTAAGPDEAPGRPEVFEPPQRDVESSSEPAPSEPASSDPAPSEPASSEPAPSEPAPSDDDLDLDLERRKRINDLYYALDLLDHYRVLGVERTAPRKEIRNAYFVLSKVFHPDTMFRKRLGPYKARMESIFQRLTEAYETLGKKKHRAEYDRYLGLADTTRELEGGADLDAETEERERLGRAAAQFEADVAAGRSAPGQPPPAPPSSSAKPAPEPDVSATTSSTPPGRTSMSAEGKRRQRELMAQKLRSAARSSSSTRRRRARSPSPRPSSTASTRQDRKEVLRNLASSLRVTGEQTGGVSPLRRHLSAAKRSESAGDLAEAANHVRNALLVAPDDEAVKAEYDRINGRLAAELASTYEERAQYEQKHGKWAAAALSWSKVVAGRPEDAMAARSAAEALVEARGDMHKAKSLAQRATELEPNCVDNLRVLARVYIAAGLELNARRVLQDASKLDPNDEMVENLLRELGR